MLPIFCASLPLIKPSSGAMREAGWGCVAGFDIQGDKSEGLNSGGGSVA